jgi:hypothetical protein
MANVLHLAQNMEEQFLRHYLIAPAGPTPPILAFIVAVYGPHGGRGHRGRGGRGGRVLPNNYIACDNLEHIMSSCTTSDDAQLKWTLA